MESKLLRIMQYNSTKPLAFLCFICVICQLYVVFQVSETPSSFLLYTQIMKERGGVDQAKISGHLTSQFSTSLSLLYDPNSLSVRVLLLIQSLVPFFKMYICPYGIVFLKINFGHVAEKHPQVSERGNIFRSFGTATWSKKM